MNRIKPSKNRLVVKVLVKSNEKQTASGIIIPEAKNITKEIALGEVIAINDVDSVSGAVVGDKIYYRSMSALECSEGVGIMNVNSVEGVLAE